MNNEEYFIMVARNFNYMGVMAYMTYGTRMDFINDILEQCLKDGIISKEASTDKFWSENNIPIEECEKLEYKNKHDFYRKIHTGFESSPEHEIPNHVWNIDLKKVILPDGWYMKRDCDKSEKSFFSIYNRNGELLKTLEYFSKYHWYLDYPPKHMSIKEC